MGIFLQFAPKCGQGASKESEAQPVIASNKTKIISVNR